MGALLVEVPMSRAASWFIYARGGKVMVVAIKDASHPRVTLILGLRICPIQTPLDRA